MPNQRNSGHVPVRLVKLPTQTFVVCFDLLDCKPSRLSEYTGTLHLVEKVHQQNG